MEIKINKNVVQYIQVIDVTTTRFSQKSGTIHGKNQQLQTNKKYQQEKRQQEHDERESQSRPPIREVVTWQASIKQLSYRDQKSGIHICQTEK